MESIGCLGDRNFSDRGDRDSVFGRPERIPVLAILGLAVVVSPVATIDPECYLAGGSENANSEFPAIKAMNSVRQIAYATGGAFTRPPTRMRHNVRPISESNARNSS